MSYVNRAAIQREFSIAINSNMDNVTTDYNNMIMRYKLPSPLTLNNYDVGLKSCSFYNSFNNITAALGNNTFSVIQGTHTYNYTIPDGMYQISDISDFINFSLKGSGVYVLDDKGENIEYISMLANPIYERCTIDFAVVPTSDPNPTDSYDSGANVVFNGTTMQLVLTNPGLAALLGYIPGTYPTTPQSSAISFDGTLLPKVSKVEIMYVCLQKVDESDVNILTEYIYQTQPTGGIRELVTIKEQNVIYRTLTDGTFNEFVVYFRDQSLDPIRYSDQNLIAVELSFTKRI